MSQSVPWNRFCGLILPFVRKPQWVYVGTEITLGETFVHLSRNQEEWVRLKQAESCLNDKCLYRTFCESCSFLPLASVFLDAFIHECLLYQPGTTWISHFLLVSCPFVPMSLFLLILFSVSFVSVHPHVFLLVLRYQFQVVKFVQVPVHFLACGTGTGTSFSYLIVGSREVRGPLFVGVVSTILITHTGSPGRENLKVLNIVPPP